MLERSPNFRRVMNHGGIVGGQHLQQFWNRMSGWV
jgi:hypothetical protein